jgi:hypothetical protein
MEIICPNYIRINNRILIYDVFISYKNEVTIIYNPGFVSREEINCISVKSNGKKLNFIKELLVACDGEIQSGEIIGILFYQMESNIVNIKILDIEKEFIIKKHNGPTNIMAMSTLLHEPHYNLLPYWIDHNIKIGIDHFFLYINGQINDTIINILDKYKNIVTLIEWNYPWYTGYFHSAQIQSLNHCLYYFEFKHVCFFDCDEFIYTNGKNIEDLIFPIKEFPCVYLFCKWVKSICDSEKIEDILNNKVIKNKNLETFEYNRKKTIIIRREISEVQLVHGLEHLEGKGQTIDQNDAGFYHYLDFNSRPNKKEHINQLSKKVFKETEISNPIMNCI